MNKSLAFLMSFMLLAGLAFHAMADGGDPNATAPKVWPAADKSDVKRQPAVQVVFVLDTTGSMSGLIAAAKAKIWAIANTMATAKPTPRVHVGLVAYRDRGDTYVTQRMALTEDLDAVHSVLMGYSANGGELGPESVNQALNEAVTGFDWSQDDHVFRVIFLVGDAPPHMDYSNDVKYPASCTLAAKKGITINAIQCGSMSATGPIWQDIARRAEGRFFRVEQSGGAILVDTPFDRELADLAKKLDTTRVYYGGKTVLEKQKKRDAVAREIYKKASISMQASRAEWNTCATGNARYLGTNELVRDVMAKRVKLADMKKEDLPEPMRKMNAMERTSYVAKKAAERKTIEVRMKQLSVKRQKFLGEKAKEKRQKGEQSLDDGIYDSIQAQAAKNGLEYDGEAVR